MRSTSMSFGGLSYVCVGFRENHMDEFMTLRESKAGATQTGS
jgi:hypothetical protein